MKKHKDEELLLGLKMEYSEIQHLETFRDPAYMLN